MRIIQDRDEFMNDVKQFADGYRSRNKEVDALRTQVASLEERLRKAEKELQNVVNQAEHNPFLAIGMLVEHHSNIKQVLAAMKEKP